MGRTVPSGRSPRLSSGDRTWRIARHDFWLDRRDCRARTFPSGLRCGPLRATPNDLVARLNSAVSIVAFEERDRRRQKKRLAGIPEATQMRAGSATAYNSYGVPSSHTSLLAPVDARSGARVACTSRVVCVNIQGRPGSLDDLLGDHDFFYPLKARQLKHGVEQNAFHDRA
jgi:hypothetical protein